MSLFQTDLEEIEAVSDGILNAFKIQHWYKESVTLVKTTKGIM